MIVNVWGTWFPPCRRLVPRLGQLLAKEGKRGLAVVGINYKRVPAPDVKTTVEAFISKNRITYPTLGDDKTRGRVPRLAGFPTTLFLNFTGMVRLTVPGELRPLDLEAITTSLLDEEGVSEAAKPREVPAERPVDVKSLSLEPG